MINCEKAKELAGGYIDGMLDEAQALAYEEHISCCDLCHNEYDMLKKISVDLSQTVAPLPKGFEKRARQSFASGKVKKTVPLPYLRTASALAAALVIAAVGKFGVYDIYKNVTDKNEIASNEIVDRRTAEKTPTVDNAKKDTAETDGKEKSIKKVYVEPSPYEPAEESTVVPQETELAAEEPVVQNETAEVHSVAEESEYGAAAASEIDSDAVQAGEAESFSTARMGRAVSGGGASGSSAENADTASDEATALTDENAEEVATELVAAYVTLHKGDGSTEAFKKFLKTFLDDSCISETDAVITVTVEEKRYESVVAKIRSNEYVKSVSDGTPFGGIGVINISVK